MLGALERGAMVRLITSTETQATTGFGIFGVERLAATSSTKPELREAATTANITGSGALKLN